MRLKFLVYFYYTKPILRSCNLCFFSSSNHQIPFISPIQHRTENKQSP